MCTYWWLHGLGLCHEWIYVSNIHCNLHCVVVVVQAGIGIVVFLCGGCDCMWWWLYVVVEAVHGGDGHLCGNEWGYYCMIVYVHGGCGL